MEYQSPKSKCGLCDSEFKRQGLTRHIKSCLTKHLQKPTKGKPKNLVYLNVYDTFNPDYFLHLLIVGKSKLKDLDFFLRGIWLECCGHLSSFSCERYGDEINMKNKVEDVFVPGQELNYQYDFGSTTELVIKAVDNYHGTTEGYKKIQIIARNAQPLIPCDECGVKPAVQICTECQWEESGWLCQSCAEEHECDEEM